jgi:hypothetical protein
VSLRKILTLTLLTALMIGLSINAFCEKVVNPELITQTAFTPDNSTGVTPAATEPTDESPSTKPNIWMEMLLKLLDQVSAVAVPAGVLALMAWLSKRLGWDIPVEIEKALEAFILNIIANIKNQYGKDQDAGGLKRLAITMVTDTISNKMLKALKQKYGTVDAAVEFYYQKSYKPVHIKR